MNKIECCQKCASYSYSDKLLMFPIDCHDKDCQCHLQNGLEKVIEEAKDLTKYGDEFNAIVERTKLLVFITQVYNSGVSVERARVKSLREKFAELEHDQWIVWSKNIAETENITSERLVRWQVLWKPYHTLTEAQKDQDREWADKILVLLDNSK